MKRQLFHLAEIVIVLCCFANPIHSQVKLITHGKSSSRIILATDNRLNRTGASLLQRFIRESSNCNLPVKVNVSPKPNDIVLGGETSSDVTTDGFSFSTKGKILRIAGKGNGVVYGAVTLLEKYFNMDYLGDKEYTLPHLSEVSLPCIQFVDNPAFEFRMQQCYALEDSVYRWWHRLETESDMFVGGYFVHTIENFVPVNEYGKSHPEYYAYFDGARHPEAGQKTQLCFSNKDVLDIVIHRVDSIFKSNPTKNTIAISQDDNNNYCQCDECRQADLEEGEHSGSIIRFINKVAAKFPDKKIVTLAYMYSVSPPIRVKPLPNVVIMLCNVGCFREVPMTDNGSGQGFLYDLEGWGKISKNIFMWDYGINYANLIAPFPNFHIMQPNMQLFKKSNTSMLFSEIESTRGTDFAELRAYLTAKLMWNPDLNMDSLTYHFLNAYYGKAAPYLYDYIRIMEGALIAGGKELYIQHSPIYDHKDDVFKPLLMKRYKALYDQAEQAVANNPEFLKRVQRSRLSLQFAELELNYYNMEAIKQIKNKPFNERNEQLNLFEKRLKEFNINALSEGGLTPENYIKNYREEMEKNKINR